MLHVTTYVTEDHPNEMLVIIIMKRPVSVITFYNLFQHLYYRLKETFPRFVR